MENSKMIDIDKDYEYIKTEIMSFIDEEKKDEIFDSFIKLAVY